MTKAVDTSQIVDSVATIDASSAVTYENLNANGDVGSTSGTVCAGNDSRLSDARVASSVSDAVLGSGTASSSTYLRGDRTWATVTAPNYATGNAALSAGGVGTYGWFWMQNEADVAFGGTVAGSGLKPCGGYLISPPNVYTNTNWSSATYMDYVYQNTAQSGTWRVMCVLTNGNKVDTNNNGNIGLFLRIS